MSNGGEMQVPEGWVVKKLHEITINHDSKRVPVKSLGANRN